MKKLRIAIVMEATEGGTRKHLRLLARGLDKDLFDVHLIVSTLREREFLGDIRLLRESGCTVHVLDMVRGIRPWRDVVDFVALRQLLRRLRPDVVHSHGSKGGVLGRLAARSAGVARIIHTPHAYVFQWTRGLTSHCYLAVEKFCAARCDAVVSVGPGQERTARENHAVDPAKLVLIENGVDPSEIRGRECREEARKKLGILPDAPCVGAVARLVPQKGCRLFVRAAALAAEKMPEARFVLVGRGPLQPDIRRLAESLRISDSLVMTGHIEQTGTIYPAFDVLALTSVYEGLPYVALEGMAAGLPVVATRIPGIEDIVVDGKTGYLVEPGNAEETAARFVELLGDARKRAEMGAAGQELVREKFALDKFIEKHQRLYLGQSV